MFDYVSRERFDAERERRIKAEVIAERAGAQLTKLQEANAQLLSLLDKERERHRDEIADALDRFAPKPKDLVPGFGIPGNGGPLTAEEILHIPAVGKRGLRERNAAVREAKEREEKTDTETDGANRRATLNEEEQALVDQQLEAVRQ